MARNKSRCLIIICEGATEKNFYSRCIRHFIPHERKSKVVLKNLGGKITNKSITTWLSKYLHQEPWIKGADVIIVYDRDGDFSFPGKLNCGKIKNQLDDNRIFKIDQIIATREIESWFHFDAKGVHDFFGIPAKKRKANPYPNPHSISAKQLETEAAKYGMEYRKGDGAEKLLVYINLDTLYNNCPEFKDGVDLLKKLL